MALKIHIDQPADVELTFERDTTPKLDLDLYHDEEQTDAVDVTLFTFEAYLKSNFETDNGSASLTWTDAAVVKQPDGATNRIRLPITQVQSNDSDVLLDKGVILVYWTDSTGHRERLIRGSFTSRR